MKFIVPIVCLLFLFSCRYNNKQDVNVQNDVIVQNNELSKFEKQKQFLHERTVSSISIILSDTIFVGKCILLVYDEMDCDDCIKNGFNIINRLDTLRVPNTFVLTSTPNPGRHQLLYDYPKYVFVDKQDLVRKDLKYITTPILLVLDEHKRIQQILFPGVSSKKEEDIFIESCLNW